MSLKFRNGTKHHSSPISQLIDKATDSTAQSSENWQLFMTVCDAVNASEDGPKEAVKAIRKRFALKQPTTTTLTLKLLEACVKNCGKRFHIHIATKEFMQELIKIISPKYNPSVELQNQVLGLIQMWAHAFQSSIELKEVCKQYQELKAKGIEFPPLDTELASQIHIPSTAPAASSQQLSSPMSPTGHVQSAQRSVPASQNVTEYQPHQQQTLERVTKLRSELGAVQRNCRVFGELLTEMASGQENPSDLELLEDLNVACHQMQQRIVELLGTIQIEQITEELLAVNDELNNVFLRYERFQRLRTGRSSSHQQQHTEVFTPSETQHTHCYQPTLATSGVPGFQPTQPTAGMPGYQPTQATGTSGYQPTAGVPGYQPMLAMKQDVAVAKLIDFDTDTSTSVAALSLDGHSNATWPPCDQPSKPPVDREDDIAEMEKWLQTNSQSQQPTGGATQTTATSSEFDIFLSQRAHDADLLPDLSQQAAPGGQGSNLGSSGQGTSELFTL